MSKDEFLKTGTTTVGIIGKDIVILAADKRATAGNMIVDKHVEKVLPINDTMALTMAGTVSDIQFLVKYLKAELKLKELRTGRKATVKEAATLMSGFNYNNIRRHSIILGVAHFLFAGYDNLGPHLFDLFPDGSITKVNDSEGFNSTGSGSVYALGVLEDAWKPNLSEQEASELAIRAINSALKRDTASGQGIDIFVIDKNGVRKGMHKTVSGKLE